MALNKRNLKKTEKMKRRLIFRTVTLIIILATFIYALYMNITSDNNMIRGEKAPDFELSQINNNHAQDLLRLSDLEGKGVVVNFWADYCKPCESQLAYMEALYAEYQDEIEIIGVNLDNSEIVAQQFIQKFNLSFPVVHDLRDEIMNMYHVTPIPTTFFINEDGQIIDEYVGTMSYQNLESNMQRILSLQGE